jgi:putative hemolysin
MEQKNKRYFEIYSCTKCGYSGHISSDDECGIVFICSNPDHTDLEIPRKFIGKTSYPIIVTEQRNTVHMCPIPSWCTLPKEVVVFDRNSE